MLAANENEKRYAMVEPEAMNQGKPIIRQRVMSLMFVWFEF